MSVLILGSDGQVGTYLRNVFQDAVFWNRQAADLADRQQLVAALRLLKPRTIINCAAYTQVDLAESQAPICWAVNADAPALIAATANEWGAKIVYISTDYVFDGKSETPYAHDNQPSPVTVYGKSKLAGELATTALSDNSIILRVSWVFGSWGSNFVKTMLRVGSERNNLEVVDDQIGCPTYAGDIAQAIKDITNIESGRSIDPGVYHLCGGPPTSWFEFAKQIFEVAVREGKLIKSPPEIMAISSDQYPTAAKRPKNSVLAHSIELNDFLTQTPDWRTGLRETIKKLESI